MSECRSGVEVSECRCPTQTASILSQSCKFRFLKSNSTFTTTYGRQPLAVACSCSVGRLAVARRGGGVHHGDGDGQAVVQEKGAALAAQPAWEKHTEEQASIMAWCAACPAVLAQSHGEQRQPQELQDLRKRRQEQGRWQQHWVQHRRWQRQGLRGPERGAEVQDVGDGEARVEGVGGVSGVSRVSGVSEVSSVGSVGSVEMP